MKHALPVALLLAATGALTRQEAPTAELRELRLVDAEGRVRAVLAAEGLDGPGARLVLNDSAGRPACRLVLDDGPGGAPLVGLELLGEGSPRAWLGTSTAPDVTGAELRLLGPDGTPRAELTAAPALWLRNPARPADEERPERPEGHVFLGAGGRFGAPDAAAVLGVEAGASGLRFEAEEQATSPTVRRADGRWVRLLTGY